MENQNEKILISDNEKDSLQRNWEENHCGRIVDKMMAVNFEDFSIDVIVAAAIMSDLFDQDQEIRQEVKKIILDEEIIKKLSSDQTNTRQKIREKLLALVKPEEKDYERFEDATGFTLKTSAELINQLAVSYRMQKRAYLLRMGKDIKPLHLNERMNREFLEAVEYYVHDAGFQSETFFKNISNREQETHEEDDYDEQDIESETQTEIVESATGWILVRAIKNSDYEKASKIISSGVVLEDEMKETLNALKIKALKNGDYTKSDYIDTILN